jgi:hypothetical protein
MSYLAPTIEEPGSDLIDFTSPRTSALYKEVVTTTSPGKKESFDTPTRRSPEGRRSSSSFRKYSPERNSTNSFSMKSRSPALEPSQNANPIGSNHKEEHVKEKSGGDSASCQVTPADAECTVSISLRRVIASEPGRWNSPSIGLGAENRRAMPSGDASDSPFVNSSVVEERSCTHRFTISDELHEQAKRTKSEQYTSPAPTSPSGEITRSSAMRMFKSFSTPKKKTSEDKSSPSDAHASSKRLSILRRSHKSEGNNTKEHRKNANSGDGASALPRTPQKKFLSQGSPVSARMSVKALAARYNTTETIPPYMHTPNSSPMKGIFDPSSVLSPYTINPSPTRSQRSGKLGKQSPTALRDPMYRSPTKVSVPRRLLKESFDDRTSLRSTGRSFDGSSEVHGLQIREAAVRNISSRKFSVPYAGSPLDNNKTIMAFDGHITASPSILLLPSSNSPPLPPLPYHVHFGAQHAVSSNNICDASRIHSGAGGLDSAQGFHIPLPGPIIPTRSNSVLHTQVRTLQRNLDAKTEQVRQLKLQLENKGTQDIRALSEQLREAKKEAQAWKLKAVIAEKQLEVMTELSAGRRLLDWTEQSDKTNLRRVESRPALGESTRQAIRGMDGAASSQRLSSEQSSDKILHGLAVTGSEFDSWADQVGTDLSSRSILELDSKLELHISKLELYGNSSKLLDFGDSD